MGWACFSRSAVAAAILVSAALSPANAASCGNGPGGFNAWVDGFMARAAAAGVSKSAIASGLSGLSYDSKVIRLDRNQKSFKLSFQQFYARRAGGGLIARGRSLMGKYKSTLDSIEKRFGVDREILIAIWGLETSYGADRGQGFSIPNSLATLAYDCRRSAFFEKELLATLKIIDRGDMSKSQLRGGWAGEIGQTQFLPSIYIKYGVDFDGSGGVNLNSSAPDVLASTARFLQANGWKLGAGWGPGTSNYSAIEEWNRATVYQKTIAKMADQLAGKS